MMYCLYETSLLYAGQSPHLETQELRDLFLDYCAWADVNSIDCHALPAHREEYLLALYPPPGDAISRIFALDDNSARETAIRFLCLPAAFWEGLCAHPAPEPPNTQKVSGMMEALRNPALISRLIGIDPGDIPLHLHISSAASREIRMRFLSDMGVFLSVGLDVSLDAYASWHQEDILLMFKALADKSRLEMVRALLKDALSATQLAEKAGLTLSTINHHVTKLVEARLVNLAFSSKPGKGALFEANRPVIAQVLELIRQEAT